LTWSFCSRFQKEFYHAVSLCNPSFNSFLLLFTHTSKYVCSKWMSLGKISSNGSFSVSRPHHQRV
jgi:hypothetical protein